MNRNLIFKLLAIPLCCLGIIMVLNTFYSFARAQDTKEPSVTITADVTTGDVPLVVSFTSTVNDPFEGKYPITHDWHFDDGAASTKQNPQHTFNEPGEYHVMCRVTFWKSPKVTVEASVEIKVSEAQPLAVSISADPTSGKAPLTVNFTSTVTGVSSGGKIAYKWDFGDEVTSEEINPTHTFNSVGTYTVRCTVTEGTPSRTALDTIEINVTPTWPAAVCTENGDQYYPLITADGSGGVIITWQDRRGGDNWDIYAQRVDSTGKTLWTSNGVAICTAANSQEDLQITTDSSGGAVITWQDNRNGNYDIYAQRIDSTGKILWAENGLGICTAANHQYFPQITSDGSGGAIITWQDFRSGSYDIYSQRISGNGEILWNADGVAICTAGNNQGSPQIISDGSGSVIITWNDHRSRNSDIYVQRIDNIGTPKWTGNGVAICMAAINPGGPEIISDGSGGAIITWEDQRNGNYDIYARRIDSTGKPLWTPDGEAICTAENTQYWPQITTDGFGGAIITWHDKRSNNDGDIYAQRIDSTGKLVWTANGVAICTAVNYKQNPQITFDDSGGAIITWFDYRSGNYDIYAQRLDSTGKPMWITDGVAIGMSANDERFPQITSNGSGGAFITWQNSRSGSGYDIYAQRITKDGELK
jgi:PKD repeat protein